MNIYVPDTKPAFYKDIRIWIADTLSIEVIYSHGDGPRPHGQYAIMNVVNISKIVEDEMIFNRDAIGEITAEYNSVKKAMVSINIYRDDAMQAMANLKSSLSKISTQDYFNRVNIGIVNQGSINNIPEKIGKNWENRSQCDFFFHYIPAAEKDINVGEIKKIELTDKINDEVINIE